MKKQVVVIHGGDTFDTHKKYLSFLKNYKIDFRRLKKGGWKEGLSGKLGRGFEVIAPRMPNKTNARYLEWKIWFRKFLPHIRNRVVLVGHSLGGIFLAKYLSESRFPKKIKGVFLVAAPHDDKGSDHSLADFVLPRSLKRLEKQGGQIFIYHSKDDPVVPFVNFKKYARALARARAAAFKDKGHFIQEEFPEIVKDIKSLLSARRIHRRLRRG
jgi:predicted alpha/beta hydrolase family esterase